MARLKKPEEPRDWLFPSGAASLEADDQSSLLDVLDSVLNRGAVLSGDVILGVANVDLIYLKLSVLLAALDKVTKNDPVLKPRRRKETKGQRRRRKGRLRRHEGAKKSTR